MRTYREVYFDRIDKAETDEEIQAAYQAMIDESGGDVALVNQNLGYILGYYNTKERAAWYCLLKDVVHPVFGRGFGRGEDITNEQALHIGQSIGRASTSQEKQP